jgi:hypothetical protein
LPALASGHHFVVDIQLTTDNHSLQPRKWLSACHETAALAEMLTPPQY